MKQLEEAGSSEADVEFAREFLTEARSSEKDEEEVLRDVTAAWFFVRDVHKRKGAKL